MIAQMDACERGWQKKIGFVILKFIKQRQTITK